LSFNKKPIGTANGLFLLAVKVTFRYESASPELDDGSGDVELVSVSFVSFFSPGMAVDDLARLSVT
jgi:hypothetical protein